MGPSPLGSSQHGGWFVLRASEEKSKRTQARQKPDSFCDLILEVRCITFVIFSWLELSHFSLVISGPTLGKGITQGMNTRRWR